MNGLRLKAVRPLKRPLWYHGRDANGLNSGRNSGDGRNGWTWEMLKKRKGLIQLNY